jgi:Ras-related protein Rab-8A
MSRLNRTPIPIKLLIVGDSGVGKSSFMVRYIKHTFDENYTATVGIDFMNKQQEINNVLYGIQIWDTAGQERFRTLTKNYYRGAMGIIIMYDVMDQGSFNSIDYWIQSIKTVIDHQVLVVLVGNKQDTKHRVISVTDGKQLAEQNNIAHFECSSGTDTNVKEVFDYMIHTIIAHNKPAGLPKYLMIGNLDKTKQDPGTKCCFT